MIERIISATMAAFITFVAGIVWGMEIQERKTVAQLSSNILYISKALYACSKVDPIKPESF